MLERSLITSCGWEIWPRFAPRSGTQAADARDAAHLLEMPSTNRFPKIWRPSLEERDLRQLPLASSETSVDVGAVKNHMFEHRGSSDDSLPNHILGFPYFWCGSRI